MTMNPNCSGVEPELYRRGVLYGAKSLISIRLIFTENLNRSFFALAAVGGHAKVFL